MGRREEMQESALSFVLSNVYIRFYGIAVNQLVTLTLPLAYLNTKKKQEGEEEK